MKIINEKGKLFGLINIVDLLALLAAVAVVCGIGWKLLAPQVAEAVSPTVTLTATMRVRGATPVLVEEVLASEQVGKKLVSGNSYVDAEITDMWIEDYVVQVQCADGRIVNSTDPVKKDIVFLVETRVTKDTPSPKIGTQEVRMGRTFILKTNDFENTCNIDSVVISE